MSRPDAPFDRVAVLDWSASAAKPRLKPKADAIWLGLCDGTTTTRCFPTRHAAESALHDLMALPGRLLIGCDFAMGYPTGFAARLTGIAKAEAVWAWLSHQITDGTDNKNNRFAVAAAINLQMGQPLFWGRPATLALPDLPATRPAALGFAQRRQVDTLIPRAQSVWKLYTTGAVGSQSLMGLPMIHRLSQRPDVSIWPFARPDARVVVAEVYPSLLAAEVRAATTPGGIKDEVQVRLLAQALWRLNTSGGLSALLESPELGKVGPAIAREEGWILGAGHVAALQQALQ